MSQQGRRDRNESGQTFAEYAVVLGVITVGIVVALTMLTKEIAVFVNRVSGFLGA